MRSAFKLSLMALVSISLIPCQMLVMAFSKGKAAYFFARLWHKAVCAILGIKVEFIGKPATHSQIFFVGNHLSHFDIFILASKLKASFVAKEDLANSPVVNFFCKLQQTALISRSSSQAAKVSNNVKSMLDSGKDIILFPEGTSTRGETVLDFKSSLFSLPLEYAPKGIKIQPFTIKLLRVDGKPAITKELQDLYAWDRDNPIELGPHILNFSRLKGAELQVIFHDIVTIMAEEDRKSLSQRIHGIVSRPLDSGHNSHLEQNSLAV